MDLCEILLWELYAELKLMIIVLFHIFHFFKLVFWAVIKAGVFTWDAEGWDSMLRLCQYWHSLPSLSSRFPMWAIWPHFMWSKNIFDNFFLLLSTFETVFFTKGFNIDTRCQSQGFQREQFGLILLQAKNSLCRRKFFSTSDWRWFEKNLHKNSIWTRELSIVN